MLVQIVNGLVLLSKLLPIALRRLIVVVKRREELVVRPQARATAARHGDVLLLGHILSLWTFWVSSKTCLFCLDISVKKLGQIVYSLRLKKHWSILLFDNACLRWHESYSTIDWFLRNGFKDFIPFFILAKLFHILRRKFVSDSKVLYKFTHQKRSVAVGCFFQWVNSINRN